MHKIVTCIRILFTNLVLTQFKITKSYSLSLSLSLSALYSSDDNCGYFLLTSFSHYTFNKSVSH